jgi:hypothetical protein
LDIAVVFLVRFNTSIAALLRALYASIAMIVILCPGMHAPQLTDTFWNAVRQRYGELYAEAIPPAQEVPEANVWGVVPLHVLQFLNRSVSVTEPILMISFSAGVVGAIAAAWAWQLQGGSVRAFLALDGWGVPLSGSFPIYRLSHDKFTHWSSQPLGMGQAPFYAEPDVGHLDLWRSPEQAWGWWLRGDQPERITAADAICHILHQHL